MKTSPTLFLAAGLALAGSSGCSRNLSLPDVNALSASPAFATVAPRERLQLGASGGTAPYRYRFGPSGPLSGADASVDAATGAYQAGRLGSAQDVVLVTDAAGRTATVTVAVGPRLTISPSLNSVEPGGTVLFSASGGKPPYVFSVAVRGGAPLLDAATGAYVAGAPGDVEDDVQVSDATLDPAAVSSARILVGRALSLVRIDAGAIAPDDSTMLVALGGQPPYAFSIPAAQNGSGGTVLQTGVYQAGPAGSTSDTVVVTDRFGEVASLVIPVGPSLALDLSATEVHPGVMVKLTASGGKPPYRFGFLARGNRSHGTVDPNTGDYTPGVNVGATDLLVVTDATGLAQATPALQPRVGGVRLPAVGIASQCLAADFTGDRRDDILLFQGTTLQLWSQPAGGPSRSIDHFLWYAYGAAAAGFLNGMTPAKLEVLGSGNAFAYAPDLTGVLTPTSTAYVPASAGTLSFASRSPGAVPSMFTNGPCAGGFNAVDWAFNAAAPTSPAVCVPVPGAASALALVAADFNGDGYADLAWIPAGATSVIVNYGSSTGVFGAPNVLAIPAGYQFVQDNGPYASFMPVTSMVASLRSDLLLRVVDGSGRGWVALVKTGASPAFAPGGPFDPLPQSPVGAVGFREVKATVDKGQSYVAWDGRSSAVGAFTFDAAGIPSVRGAANPVFASDPAFPVGCVASGDFDYDGLPDLVLASATGATAEVRWGDGRGYGVRPRFEAPGPLAIADVDGDGLDDVVTATATPGIAVLLGSGHQLAFAGETALQRAAIALGAGRLASGAMGVTWQDALGAFWTAGIDASGVVGTPAPLDVRNGDGTPFSSILSELHAAANGTGPADLWGVSGGQLHLVRPTGTGTAVHAITPTTPVGGCVLAPFGAGAGDVVAACGSYGVAPNVYRSKFDGASRMFGAWTGPTAANAATLAVNTFIGRLPDGSAVFYAPMGTYAGILTVTPAGAGLTASVVQVAGTTDSIESATVADVTGDGLPDVVFHVYVGGTVDVLAGQAGGGYAFRSSTPGNARILGAVRLAAGAPPDVLMVPYNGGSVTGGTIVPLVNDGSGNLH